MMKKYTLAFCAVMIFSLSSYSTASIYTNQMYCTLHPDGVQIVLRPTDGMIACLDYIAAADAILSRITRDLLLVQSYISRGEDVLFWMDVREELRERFLFIDTVKKNIQSSMELFESNIFAALQRYIQTALLSYYNALQMHLDDMYDFYENDMPSYVPLLIEQIDTIQAIRTAVDFDDMLPLAARYLYLRRELA